jgi:hypothetical protein
MDLDSGDHMPTSHNAAECTLWNVLHRSGSAEAADVLAALGTILPSIELVLASAATSPTDFTLHDDQHAFRVAQQMAEILPPSVLEALNPYELGLLILSAYLHDIGMTPQQRLLERHWKALICTPESLESPLTQSEREHFQAWLDDYADDIQLPLCTAAPTEDEVRLADKLVTHYARARHNDWSEAWISTHLAGRTLGSYEDWVADLIALCRSHHYGYEELRDARFDPRQAGSGGAVVHLRYLACVLRVADVLDVDPERTPDVVFAHRQIAAESVLYWRKDHATWLSRTGTALVITARPYRAAMEKAIRETAAGIEAELQLVARLNREIPFAYCSFRGVLPHTWDYPEAIDLQVQPFQNAYVYIDGAFRPNTRKLLQLLSGTQLYRDPLVAIRELIQNACDAIKEEIALQRLRTGSATDEYIARQHKVELRLEQRDDRYWLVCTDTGVGMTQSIIRDYLLVSGAGRRHDIADLERRCRAAGFVLKRTGEFGIGVLSYFMLADRVEMRTRRTHSVGGVTEPTGWYFETEGVGSFGELRRDEGAQQGSEVRLRLRKDEIKDPAASFLRVRKYLHETLRVLPCSFELTSPLAGCESLTIAHGWVREERELNEELVRRLQQRDTQDLPLELMPRADQERIKATQIHYDEIRREARDAVRWHSKAGDLPDGLGTYRIHVPVFALSGGISAGFLRSHVDGNQISIGRVGKGIMFRPEFESHHSWRGMATHLVLENEHRRTVARRRRFKCEIDWTDRRAGELSVDRGAFAGTVAAIEALRWVGGQGELLEGEVVDREPSAFDLVNVNLCARAKRARINSSWTVTYSETDPEVWAGVGLPAVSSRAFSYRPMPSRALLLNGKRVSVVPALRGHDEDSHYEGIGWPGTVWSPDRLVVCDEGWRLLPVPIWEQAQAHDDAGNRMPPVSRFPPGWKHVCCSVTDLGIVWNRAHPLMSLADAAAWTWWNNAGGEEADPLEFRAAIVAEPKRAAAWLASVVAGTSPRARWQSILERDSAFAEQVWTAVFGAPEKRGRNIARTTLVVWRESTNARGLRVFRPDGYEWVDVGAFGGLLPKPSASWILSFAEEARNSKSGR